MTTALTQAVRAAERAVLEAVADACGLGSGPEDELGNIWWLDRDLQKARAALAAASQPSVVAARRRAVADDAARIDPRAANAFRFAADQIDAAPEDAENVEDQYAQLRAVNPEHVYPERVGRLWREALDALPPPSAEHAGEPREEPSR